MHSEAENPPFLTVLVPLMNEESNLRPLADEINEALKSQTWSWECLWIDDGSTDGSLDLLKTLAAEDPRHRWIAFESNAGQSAALYAGFRAAQGTWLATLDADGQNDPADLPRLVELLDGDQWDMVNGYRAKRRDSWSRRLASRIGNGFRNAMTGKTVRDVGCSTRVFRRICADCLPPFKGMHRFLPTLIALQGFRITEVPVNHRPRERGTSKYNNWNRMWVGLSDLFGVRWFRKRAFRYRLRT